MMNANKRPQLVISFASLQGGARQIVSAQVQTLLFAMGYLWSDSFWNGSPQHANKSSLHICSHEWNPRHITWSNGPVETVGEGCTLVFDAASQLDAFLEAARVGLRYTTTLEGVEVTVMPDNVLLNPTTLLERVSKEAATIQRELWG